MSRSIALGEAWGPSWRPPCGGLWESDSMAGTKLGVPALPLDWSSESSCNRMHGLCYGRPEPYSFSKPEGLPVMQPTPPKTERKCLKQFQQHCCVGNDLQNCRDKKKGCEVSSTNGLASVACLRDLWTRLLQVSSMMVSYQGLVHKPRTCRMPTCRSQGQL